MHTPEHICFCRQERKWAVCPHRPATQFLELDTLLHKPPGPLVKSWIQSSSRASTH